MEVGKHTLIQLNKAIFREASLSVIPRIKATFARIIDAAEEPCLEDAIDAGALDWDRKYKALLSRITGLEETFSGKPVELPDFSNFRRKAA